MLQRNEETEETGSQFVTKNEIIFLQSSKTEINIVNGIHDFNQRHRLNVSALMVS